MSIYIVPKLKLFDTTLKIKNEVTTITQISGLFWPTDNIQAHEYVKW